MTSISAASTNTYQSPLQKLQDELQSEVNSGADQFVRPGRAVVGADGYQFLAAGEPGQRPGQRHAAAPGDLKSKIDDLIDGEVSSAAS